MTRGADHPIAVLGAGSWGTALAVLLAGNGHPTCLWGRDRHRMALMAEQRRNAVYLPETAFPPQLAVTSDLAQALSATQDILLVVPSHAFRSTVVQLQPWLSSSTRLAWATKGLEPGTRKLLSQVVEETAGRERPTAVLSGPTFAREVVVGLPTAVTIASRHPDYAQWLVESLRNESFRPYTSEDMVGVQVGGAVKNVLAIAAGIADGLGFGANTRAALITRGLAEVIRLGEALGGRRETFLGLAGLGDLVLTCTDDLSRNRRLGLLVGRGKSVAEAQQTIGQVVEGVTTVAEVIGLSRELAVEMPITERVNAVLHQGQAPREAVHALLARQTRAEGL